MRGRKALPSKIKKLHGARRSRINKKEPQPKIIIPKCPEGLGKHGKEEWNRITKLMLDLRMVSELDLTLIFIYCQAWEQFIETAIKLRSRGPVLKSSKGTPMFNPFWTVNNKAREDVRKLTAELGLSPTSRARLKIETPEKDEDGIGKYLKGT